LGKIGGLARAAFAKESFSMYKGIILLLVTMPLAGGIKKETFVHYTQEQYNNCHFTHRVDMVDGVIKEQWSIEGVQVEAATYEQAILEAEMAERAQVRKARDQERRAQELELVRQQEFNRQSRLDIYRKKVQLALVTLETELAKLKDSRLVPYYAYSPQTFEHHEAFMNVVHKIPEQANQLLNKPASELSESALRSFGDFLEALPIKVRVFYRETIKQAIDRCNDTQLLKELLELCS
jgi:hypothetical protein